MALPMFRRDGGEQRSPLPPAERLSRWNRAFNPVVVAAAILGLAPLADDEATTGPGAAFAIGSWLVFLVDFVVRTRIDGSFLGTWKGRTYLVIVVITFPLFLVIPRLEETDLLAVTRLGWLTVLAISGVESLRDARVLIRRLGVAGLSALTAVVVAALLVRRVEQPGTGFDTYGESLWWSLVTITTVGYGDRVPSTGAGQLVAALLMITGLALLGIIAASLAAHFGYDDGRPPQSTSHDEEYRLLLEEVRALRDEVARLVDDRALSPPEFDDAPSDLSGHPDRVNDGEVAE